MRNYNMEPSKQSQVSAEVSESSRRRQDGGTAVTKEAQQQERLRGGRGRCVGPDGRLRAVLRGEARRNRLPDLYTRRLREWGGCLLEDGVGRWMKNDTGLCHHTHILRTC